MKKKLSKICKSPYVVSVNSGFDAIKLGLGLYGIGYQDEVITVSNSYIATASAIKALGAKPIFVDIDNTYNMDPQKFRIK